MSNFDRRSQLIDDRERLYSLSARGDLTPEQQDMLEIARDKHARAEADLGHTAIDFITVEGSVRQPDEVRRDIDANNELADK